MRNMSSRYLLGMGIMGALFYLFLGVSSAQQEYADNGLSFLSVSSHTRNPVKNSFTGNGSAHDAYLYGVEVKYFPSTYTKQDIHFISLAFELSYLSYIMSSSAGEMRLVKDINGNGIPDIDDVVVSRSSIHFSEKIIFFSFDERVDTESLRDVGSRSTYFLVGDFFSLLPHAEVRIKLLERLVQMEERIENKLMRIVTTNTETWHHEGNSPPVLTYPHYLDSSKNGVTPWQGRSGDMFTFEVMYTDRDGDLAQRVEVWIDTDDNGVLDDNEHFVMQVPNPPIVAAYQRFRFSMRLIAPRSGKVLYRFFASDSTNDAVGEATQETYLYITNMFAITDTRILSDAIVPGERFDVAYTVRYFFDSVKVDWTLVSGVGDSLFTFLGLVHKDRHPLNLLHDKETMILSFQASESLEYGMINMPIIRLQAQWHDISDKQTKRVEAFSPDVVVSVVPLRAYVEVTPSRAITTIADEIRVVLTIIKKSDVALISAPEHDIRFSLSEEDTFFERVLDKNAYIDTLTYTAVLHPTAAVGILPRTRIITPLYEIEYQLPHNDAIHKITVPEQKLVFMPVLTAQEVMGPALVFPRRAIASQFRFDTYGLERAFTFVLYICGALGMGAFIIPCIVFLWSGARNGKWYGRIVARSAWKSHIRLMKRSEYPIPRDMVLSCERSFRRYLAYVYGCSEDEAQSVILWDRLEASTLYSSVIRDLIDASLKYFRMLSEGRGMIGDAVHLITLQHKLRRMI